MSEQLRRTPRTTLHRLPSRGSYDREEAHAILDEALVAHVGFAGDDGPFVLPMFYVRVGERLYLHGAVASRTLKALAAGVPACATVTLLDGLVLARSAFHHSMNYRCVVVLGTATEVIDPGEKRRVLDALVERMAEGRSREARPANEKELAATRLVAMPIDEASVKTRRGGPLDDAEDMSMPCWAGHVPLRLVAGEPIDDDHAPVVARRPALRLLARSDRSELTRPDGPCGRSSRSARERAPPSRGRRARPCRRRAWRRQSAPPRDAPLPRPR